VGGAFSLDEGFGEANTQRETRMWNSRKVRPENEPLLSSWFVFPESLLSHSHTDVYNSKVNPATATRRSNDESETVETTAKFNDGDYNVYR
jgi:hypothetical protein